MNCLKDADPSVTEGLENNLQLCNGVNGTNNGPLPSSTKQTGTSSPSATSVHQSGAGTFSSRDGVLAGVVIVAAMIGNL